MCRRIKTFLGNHTEENLWIGDMVQVHLRRARNGLVTKCGVVTEIDANRPNRVKTETCSRKFRRVLELIARSSTSMNSNDT